MEWNHISCMLYFPGIHRCYPVIHLLHLITTRTCAARRLTLTAAAELQISATRFDSFNFSTFNTNTA
ncbi:hypothetical protein [Paraburkholderia aromaticivorans]|uniref:hypothetical protein n=1 Tax=Paraburkholderia aromaticivorans TaxID=2026199 RepID=UPI00145604E3|nr:hypothetical protein [Paraburkholderia aromaticivorans]